MSETQDLTHRWKVHTPNLLKEVVSNHGADVLCTPMHIFGQMLHAVAERASLINDPELNDLMCDLTLYEVADRALDCFDGDVVDKVKTLARATRDARTHKEPPEVGYEDIFELQPYLTEDWGGGDGKCCYIDQVYVPPGLRGQGLGKELVRKFLSELPEHVERIRLKSCALGSGHTKPFWESLGFQSAYQGDIDGPDGDLSDILVMGVNGHTTPPPEVLTAETNGRELTEIRSDKRHILEMACKGN